MLSEGSLAASQWSQGRRHHPPRALRAAPGWCLGMPFSQSPPPVEGEAVLFIFLNMKEGLRDTKLLYRELGNRFGVFNASLADLEYLLGDDPGEGIVTFFKT